MLKPLNETKFKFWIVDPVESINHVENPLPWTLEGYEKIWAGGSLQVRTEHMRNGGPCLRAIDTDIKYTKPMTKLETGEQYELLVDAYAVKGSILQLVIYDQANNPVTSQTYHMGGNWQWLRLPFMGVPGATFVISLSDQYETVDNTFWIDRLSVQKGTNMTWFCGYGFSADTSLHFRWEGEPMNSRSIHNGQDRRAGKMYDLDDYMEVKRVLGLGMGDWEQRMTPILTGGALYQDMIEQPRPFSIVGVNKATKMKDLMLKRKQLSLLLRPDGNDHSPINLLFQAINKVHGYPESEELTIECVCTTALKNIPDVDTVADSTLTFMKPDPYLYANYYNGYKQDQEIEITSDNIILRKANGGWEALPGLDGEVRCLAEDNAGRIWAGGDFTGKIAYSRGGAWQVPKTDYGEIRPNGSVRAIAITPDNQVFFGGDFTQINRGNESMLTANRVAQLQPTTSINTWTLTALQGTGINDGSVHALLIDDMGKLVIGGTFSTANGSTSRGIARYDTVITGTNQWKQYTVFKAGAQIYTLAHSGRANVVCLGGYFESTMGTIKNLGQLMLDTSTVMSFGSPTRMQGSVDKIAKRPDGSFVIMGAGVRFGYPEYNFIHQGVGQIRGYSTSPLSNHKVEIEYYNGIYNAVIDEDGGVVMFSGSNVFVNDTNNCGRHPYFKNGAWNRHPDISIITDSIPTARVNDMLILRNGDIIYAGLWSGNIMVPAPSPAIMPIFTESTAGVYPIIRVFGSNRLHFIRSHKTGKVIFFKDAYVPHGSWLEMSLRRDKIQIMLDWKNALNIIGEGSDYADFTVEPGLNLMHVHAQKLPDDPAGIPGDIFVLWQPRYWSLEGSIYGSI